MACFQVDLIGLSCCLGGSHYVPRRPDVMFRRIYDVSSLRVLLIEFFRQICQELLLQIWETQGNSMTKQILSGYLIR